MCNTCIQKIYFTRDISNNYRGNLRVLKAIAKICERCRNKSNNVNHRKALPLTLHWRHWGLTINFKLSFANVHFSVGLTENNPAIAFGYAFSAIAYFFVNLKTLRSFMA